MERSKEPNDDLSARSVEGAQGETTGTLAAGMTETHTVEPKDEPHGLNDLTLAELTGDGALENGGKLTDAAAGDGTSSEEEKETQTRENEERGETGFEERVGDKVIREAKV